MAHVKGCCLVAIARIRFYEEIGIIKDKLNHMDISLTYCTFPLVGRDFQGATVTQQMGRFQIPGFQMEDMDIVFPKIPFGLL